MIKMDENNKVKIAIDEEFLSTLKEACRSVCLLTASVIFKLQQIEKEHKKKE